jgi:hypothetical protein
MDWLNQVADLISGNKIPIGKWAEVVAAGSPTTSAGSSTLVVGPRIPRRQHGVARAGAGAAADPAICAIAYWLHRNWMLVAGVWPACCSSSPDFGTR